MNIFTIARVRRALFVPCLACLFSLAITAPATAQTDPSPTTGPITEPAGKPTTQPTVSPLPIDSRYGVIESFEDPAAAARLGVAWTRVRFQWAEIQPDSAADWNSPLDDEQLAAELAAGREVVGLIIGVPDWARDRRGLPRGLSLTSDDPNNTWAVFVGDVAARFAGRIDRWIIWNEPDIDDRDAPGHTWDGTIEEYFQLQRTAYLAAKSANPDAIIHLGAFTYFWDPGYFSRFLDVVATDPEAPTHHYYFDVATAHLYFQPNAVYNILYAFRRVLDVRGLDQPIWLVETNAPPMDDPYWLVDNWTLAVTLNEQAAYIPQAMAAALAAGVERIAVYKLKDTPDDRAANPEPFGLIRWDNSRRPAYDTYRVAIRQLSGVTAAERERWDAVGQVRLEQDGQTTTVLFARLPGSQTARVKATAAEADLVDMWGKRETIESEDGYYNFELPGALCKQTIINYCMIGGTTYYLVQEAGRSAPVVYDATVAPTGTPTTMPLPVEPTPTTPPTTTSEPSQVAVQSATPPPTVMKPVALAVSPKHTPTPETEAAQPTGGETGVLQYNLGWVVLGLGLVAAVGLAGWWLAGQRR